MPSLLSRCGLSSSIARFLLIDRPKLKMDRELAAARPPKRPKAVFFVKILTFDNQMMM
jgi:hypothetical protein